MPVYSCTADAPAANMRQTCSGSEMPPHETMLACLPSRAATSAVMRSVLFSSGAPLRPPLPTASRPSSTGTVLAMTRPSAPELTAVSASAKAVRRSSGSLVHGGSLTSSGVGRVSDFRSSSTRSRSLAGSWNTRKSDGVGARYVEFDARDEW